MMVDLRCEEKDTFLGRYRGVTEDLRLGKIEVGSKSKAGDVTGFSEGELLFHPVD
jgi:hypothetical protein